MKFVEPDPIQQIFARESLFFSSYFSYQLFQNAYISFSILAINFHYFHREDRIILILL
jgi:hypothetical protein